MSKIDSILKLEDEVAIIEAIGNTRFGRKKKKLKIFQALTDEEKVFCIYRYF